MILCLIGQSIDSVFTEVKIIKSIVSSNRSQNGIKYPLPVFLCYHHSCGHGWLWTDFDVSGPHKCQITIRLLCIKNKYYDPYRIIKITFLPDKNLIYDWSCELGISAHVQKRHISWQGRQNWDGWGGLSLPTFSLIFINYNFMHCINHQELIYV